MIDCKPVSTPMASSTKLILDGSGSCDETLYRKVIGSLQYLSLTRPDIAFSVNRLAQFMHKPTANHWSGLKRLLRYLKGTIQQGLTLHQSSSSTIQTFADADWGGDEDNCRSTSAFLLYLGSNLVSWKSFKQRTVARSTTEAEYRAVASATAETLWVQSLLKELRIPTIVPVIHCDNISATYASANPVFHTRMKHLALDFHFVREKVQSGLLKVHHVPSHDQLADILTKPLPRLRFVLLRDKLCTIMDSTDLRGHVEASLTPSLQEAVKDKTEIELVSTNSDTSKSYRFSLN